MHHSMPQAAAVARIKLDEAQQDLRRALKRVKSGNAHNKLDLEAVLDYAIEHVDKAIMILE